MDASGVPDPRPLQTPTHESPAPDSGGAQHVRDSVPPRPPGRGTAFATPEIMMPMAAAVPIAFVAGVTLAISHGVWPIGLGATVALVAVLGLGMIVLVDRFLGRAHS